MKKTILLLITFFLGFFVCTTMVYAADDLTNLPVEYQSTGQVGFYLKDSNELPEKDNNQTNRPPVQNNYNKPVLLHNSQVQLLPQTGMKDTNYHLFISLLLMATSFAIYKINKKYLGGISL